MVVSRSPPPVRRSPRKDASAALDASFSSFSSHATQPRKIGKLPSARSSAASVVEPATPVHAAAPASSFPSLDQMAAASQERRSASRPADRAAFSASFPAKTSNMVPSSLPRPVSRPQMLHSDDDEQDPAHRARGARSSLTNGAIQRARQMAGDETPIAVSQAKAARQAAGAARKGTSPLLADESGDSTAQLIPGRRDAAVDPVHADIQVDVPRLPSLDRPVTSISASQPSRSETAPPANAAVDTSSASQASIFGTTNRRNGQDQPIGAANAAVGTAYDFDKYLDSELDPFNRASRANPRRESRPLPAQQQPDDEDEAESSGDTTARGSQLARARSATAAGTAPAPASAPIESTPLFSRVKAAATPRLSPHASPSVSSHKLSHLSSLSSGQTASSSTSARQSVLADSSIASNHRFDPSARADRIQTMELGELRKKHAALLRELDATQDALTAAKEESEGWASECTGLQEQLASTKSTHQAAITRESRTRAELQVRLHQYKIEADDRAWKLLGQRRQACLIDVALQHAKNEATYHEGRYHAADADLRGQMDELRIRLMLERKRADLLSLHVRAALRDEARLKKKLTAKSAASLELQAENEKLAELLEEARQSRANGAEAGGEAKSLRKELAEAQAEIEELQKRDDMMTETRKTWKSERKLLLAQIEELNAAPAPAAKSKLAAQAPQPKVSKLIAAAQELPPSSPVYAKKRDRQPMQGASELGPPSEDEVDRHVVATAATRKPKGAKSSSPLVPFAKISATSSTKAALAKKSAKPAKAATNGKSSSSKSWRDEVAITDSSEEDSDDNRQRRRGRGARDDTDSEQDSEDERAKAKASRKKSSAFAGKKSATGSSGTRSKPAAVRKNKPAMPIEYDDQTADPSATPIIRSNKRTVDDDSDDERADSSVLGAKFGRDRTNLALPKATSKPAKPSKLVAPAADEGQVKKKKRKLLGGGGAMQWGAAANDAGLAPNFDIPLELSPIKGGAASKAGGGAAFLAGFGMPSRNPFA
ncbi:hypothetical protein PANT_22d00022 [Moesziomyces antarcticus T-34]|uniref:Uncharacterized protein n=1 Tax=Pseudozyma antarctica (strain T-34) TaxID=1151754 RepID=M9MHV4_PSEA3|nr:hypothetical protein PANT_22d00022 [Moesziomyces antarcticus T-34]